MYLSVATCFGCFVSIACLCKNLVLFLERTLLLLFSEKLEEEEEEGKNHHQTPIEVKI